MSGAELDLDELSGLLKATSAGEWKADDAGGIAWGVIAGNGDVVIDFDSICGNDAHFVVAARSALPELINRLRAAEARVKELEAALKKEQAKCRFLGKVIQAGPLPCTVLASSTPPRKSKKVKP